MIASLIFLGLQAAQNASMNVLARYMETKEVQYYDKCSMVLMGIILFVFHVIFAGFIYRTVNIQFAKSHLYLLLNGFGWRGIFVGAWPQSLLNSSIGGRQFVKHKIAGTIILNWSEVGWGEVCCVHSYKCLCIGTMYILHSGMR